jgi:hypothetical protein
LNFFFLLSKKKRSQYMISGVAAVFNRDTGIDVFTPIEQIHNVNQWVAEEADVELGCGFFFDTSYDLPCVVLWRVSVCSQEYAVRLSLSRKPQGQTRIDRKFSSRVSSRTLIQLLSTKIQIVSFSRRETIFSLTTGLKAYALVQCENSMTLFRYSQFDRVVGTTLTEHFFYLAVQQASGGVCLFRKEKRWVPTADRHRTDGTGTEEPQMVRTTMLTIFNWNGPVHISLSENRAVLFSGAYAVPLPLENRTPEWERMFSCYPAHITLSLNQFSKHVSGPMYTHISDVRAAVFHPPDRLCVTTEQHRYVWSHPSGQLIDFEVLNTAADAAAAAAETPGEQKEEEKEEPEEKKVEEEEEEEESEEKKVVEEERKKDVPAEEEEEEKSLSERGTDDSDQNPYTSFTPFSSSLSLPLPSTAASVTVEYHERNDRPQTERQEQKQSQDTDSSIASGAERWRYGAHQRPVNLFTVRMSPTPPTTPPPPPLPPFHERPRTGDDTRPLVPVPDGCSEEEMPRGGSSVSPTVPSEPSEPLPPSLPLPPTPSVPPASASSFNAWRHPSSSPVLFRTGGRSIGLVHVDLSRRDSTILLEGDNETREEESHDEGCEVMGQRAVNEEMEEMKRGGNQTEGTSSDDDERSFQWYSNIAVTSSSASEDGASSASESASDFLASSTDSDDVPGIPGQTLH